MRWHCPPDTAFEIRALAVWGRTRYPSQRHPTILNLYEWAGKKLFCFFETWRPEGGGGLSPRSPTFQAGRFNHCTRAHSWDIPLWSNSCVTPLGGAVSGYRCVAVIWMSSSYRGPPVTRWSFTRRRRQTKCFAMQRQKAAKAYFFKRAVYCILALHGLNVSARGLSSHVRIWRL